MGLRLVRAGGSMRAASISIGAAVATALVLVALAIPDAVYPPAEGADAVWRANVTGALLFALTPAVVLLITTSRISSATRDRRLASLRLIGMSRARASLVAAVEAGSQTMMGALVGAVAFWALSPLVERADAAGPGWFAAPLQLPAWEIVAVVAAVVAAGAVIATAPQVRRTNTLQERSASARRRPSPWRCAVPAVGVALLVTLVIAGEDSQTWSTEQLTATLVGGVLIAGIGIAVVTPVLADLGASALLRTRRVAAVLAARGIQAEPLSTTRLVAGLAIAMYLVLGGSAVLLAFESTPQYRYALQAVENGPQHLRVAGGSWEEPDPVTLDPAELQEVEEALTAVPGVLMVTPSYELQLVGCDENEPRCHPQFFVGTCEELGHLMAVSGCSDERPGFITAVNPGDEQEFRAPERLPTEPNITVAVNGGGELPLRLGPDLVQDGAATEARWVYPDSHSVFVPERIIEATGAGARSLEVVAVGGTEIRDEIVAALPDGTYLQPSFSDHDLRSVARVRLVIYTLSAMAIGTALLGLALTTIDHARERRQVVASQLAVGMPARTLYIGLLLQALIPLAAALALATALGWLAVQAWAAASGWPPVANAQTVALVAATTMLGGMLATLATLPAARTRLTATLLRRE